MTIENKIKDLEKRQEFVYDKDIALLIELLNKINNDNVISREWLLNHQTVIIQDGLMLPVIEIKTLTNAPSVIREMEDENV